MICVSTLEMEGGGEMSQEIFFTVSTLSGGEEQEMESDKKWRKYEVFKLRI